MDSRSSHTHQDSSTAHDDLFGSIAETIAADGSGFGGAGRFKDSLLHYRHRERDRGVQALRCRHGRRESTSIGEWSEAEGKGETIPPQGTHTT